MAGMVGIDSNGYAAEDAGSVDPEVRDFVRSLEQDASAPCVPAQIWWAWRRLEETCAAAGIGLDAIVKTVIYLRQESDLKVYEAIRAMFLTERLPAFDCVLVQGPGPTREIAVQIDATALASPAISGK